jgi:acetyl-CoA carboxylase biotin carboxyl carrier protein
VAVDLRKVKKLIELVEESAIEELEVSSGDESIRIVMHRGNTVSSHVTASAPEGEANPAAPATSAEVHTVAAPMAGTFYRAPHPDAEPFVQPGQSVQLGDVLCIIESMKMMHEIHASQAGTVVQVCVDNGLPINTGDALFTLS